jgi:hypothetical protein
MKTRTFWAWGKPGELASIFIGYAVWENGTVLHHFTILSLTVKIVTNYKM